MLDNVSYFIKVSSMIGWEVTTPYTSKTIRPQEDNFDKSDQISINNSEVAKVLKPPYYWSAPKSYLGNKVSSWEEIFFPPMVCVCIKFSALHIHCIMYIM